MKFEHSLYVYFVLGCECRLKNTLMFYFRSNIALSSSFVFKVPKMCNICSSTMRYSGWPLVWKTWKCWGIFQMSGKCQISVKTRKKMSELSGRITQQLFKKCVNRLVSIIHLCQLFYAVYCWMLLTYIWVSLSLNINLTVSFSTNSTGIVWIPVKIVSSAANRQGNPREFYSIIFSSVVFFLNS